MNYKTKCKTKFIKEADDGIFSYVGCIGADYIEYNHSVRSFYGVTRRAFARMESLRTIEHRGVKFKYRGIDNRSFQYLLQSNWKMNKLNRDDDFVDKHQRWLDEAIEEERYFADDERDSQGRQCQVLFVDNVRSAWRTLIDAKNAIDRLNKATSMLEEHNVIEGICDLSDRYKDRVPAFIERSENIMHRMSNIVDGIDEPLVEEIKGMLNSIGKLESLFLGMDSFFSFVEKFRSRCSDVIVMISNFLRSQWDSHGQMLSIVSVVGSLCVMAYKGLMLLYSSVCSDDKSEERVHQSIESVILGALTMKLPSTIYEALKRSNTLTSAKPLDEESWLTSIVSIIADVLDVVVSMSGKLFGEGTSNKLRSCFAWIERYALVKAVAACKKEFADNPKIILNLKFQDKCIDLRKRWLSAPCMLEAIKRSAYLQQLDFASKRLAKRAEIQKSPSRIEPTWLIFEGPPATGKSVTMNRFLSNVGEAHYSHQSKVVEEGKDFYDSYAGEPVMVFDDQGQKGVSQYRNMIPMISCTRMTLDCANVNLKDVVEMESDLCITTTNSFMGITSLLRTDCIGDIHALHRRGQVISFERCKPAVGGNVDGFVLYYHFDVSLGKFVQSFPKVLRDEFALCGVSIKPYFECKPGPSYYGSYLENNMMEFDKWIAMIVQANRRLRRRYHRRAQDVGVLNKEAFDSFKADNMLWDDDDFVDAVDREGQGAFDDVYTMFDAVKSSIVMAFECLSESMCAHPILTSCVASALLMLSTTLISSIYNSFEKSFDSQMFSKIAVNYKGVKASTVVESIQRQTYEITIHGEKNVTMCCLVSGHFIVVPRHGVTFEDYGFVTVRDRGNILYDKQKVTLVMSNRFEDVAILKFPDNMPAYKSNLSHHFKTEDITKDLSFVTPHGSFDMVGHFRIRENPLIVNFGSYKENMEGLLEYPWAGAGMCGSMVVSSSSGVCGMHVAGVKEEIGNAVLWSKRTVVQIREILASDKYIQEINHKRLDEGVSAMRLEAKVFASTVKDAKMERSPLYEVLPCTREPPNLLLNGPHTIKDIVKANYVENVLLSKDELEFMRTYIAYLLPTYTDVSLEVAIKGNDKITPMRKDSSNGYGYKPDKTDYVDFEIGDLKEDYKPHFDRFLSDLNNDIYRIEDHMWVAQLKSGEIRDYEKKRKPRQFVMGQLHTTLLGRMLFCDLIAKVQETRHDSGIMVGVNPIREWPRMYDNLITAVGVFASDIGDFDKTMSAQKQHVINDVLLSKYVGSKSKLMDKYLGSAQRANVATNDDVTMWTHGNVSGQILTTLLNCLDSKGDDAIFYYRQTVAAGKKPSISDMNKSMFSYVYGDDRIDLVFKHPERFNALEKSSYYSSVGRKCTRADKTPVTEPFERMEDISFLKRNFVYHPLLGRISCPLSLRTIYSGLSWVSSVKDTSVVMKGKLEAFQLELFLHPELDYAYVFNKVKEAADKAGVEFRVLTMEQLLYLTTDEKEIDNFPYMGWVGEQY